MTIILAYFAPAKYAKNKVFDASAFLQKNAKSDLEIFNLS
jgi:hypothetical protein